MQFKTRIRDIQRRIAKLKKDLTKVNEKEAKSRLKWTTEYGKFMKAVEDLAAIKVHGTAKEESLRQKVRAWPRRTVELTQVRDGFRLAGSKINEELNTLGLELARLSEQEHNEVGATDEIVTQVFSLNAIAVRASEDREACLTRHVFPRLIGEDGRHLSQVSFTSSDGLRRVVAMVNTMIIIQGDMAVQAKTEIEKFFGRFQAATMDANAKALYTLTKQILIEKTNFKVGPALYQFLSMKFDEEIFPELALAQHLLRRSIKPEKTNSYIRIYERKSFKDKWEVVPQS